MSGPRIWDPYLSERDRAVAEKSGQGRRMGLSDKSALLVIDVTTAFCGDKRQPILESMEMWRNSCGEAAWDSIEAMKPIIASARAAGVPVIYTGQEKLPSTKVHAGRWADKNSRKMENIPGTWERGFEIVADLAPTDSDIVIRKAKPSAFFGTLLLSYLVELGVDSLMCIGCATSGCVRSTVIDAFSYNYRVAVVEEGCFDRTDASHAVSLFDMDQKYADVISAAESLLYFDGIASGFRSGEVGG